MLVADQGASRIHFLNDPIAVIRLVPQKRAKVQAFDERCNTHRVVTIARQQNEPDQITKRVGQRQNLRGPSALRLAYSLTQSPPFEPCPAR